MDQNRSRIRWKFLFGVSAFWGAVALYAYAYFVSWLFIGLGVLMFGGGFFIDRKKQLEGSVASDSDDKTIKSDKAEIMGTEGTVVRLKTPSPPTAPRTMSFRGPVKSYPQHVYERIKNSQDAKTLKTEAEALEQENRVKKLELEGVRLDREGERVEWEEFTKTSEAESKWKLVADKEALEKVQIGADIADAKLRIAIAEKKMRDLANEPAAPLPASDKERRQSELREVEERIAKLEEENRITKANPTLDEETKRARLNDIHDQLIKAHAERLRLL